MAYSLRLIEDRLAPGAGWPAPLAALPRVLYGLSGSVEIDAGAETQGLEAEATWHGDGAPSARAGAAGAHLLRFELVVQPPPPASGGRVVLEHPLALGAGATAGEPAWLMRCDRVDFEPGGVALPHRHRGGGIRRLLCGRLGVTVGDGPARPMRPGDAWFESGREPVLAVAAPDEPTSFVRVSILPAEIRGKTSIMYVDPDDAARSRPRTYTVYVDAPIVLGRRPR